MFTITRITAAIAVIAVAVAAGTSVAGPPAKPNAIHLTLETPSGPGRPASNLADAFAARVKALSGGKLVVDVRYDDPDYAQPTDRAWPWQARHLNNVRSGRVDLATVWAPSLELAGIKTARALHVPFMLTSEEAATRATAGALSTRIMAGFDRANLVGLALAPQGLARLFSAGKPLASTSDFTGATIRTPYGPTSVTVLKALGARPVDRSGGTFTTALSKGQIRANEINWEIASAYLATSQTARNVVLYPQVNAIVANSGAWAKLDEGQQAILRQAAKDARTRMLQRWDERREAQAFCQKGGGVTDVPKAQLDALRQKGSAVVQQFSRDAETGKLIGSIRALPRGDNDPVPLCRRAPTPTPPAASAGATTLMPSGTYRKVLDAAAMRAAGADENNINNNKGTHTLVVNGKKGSESGTNPNHSFQCAYRYSVSGPFVRIDPDPNSECAGDPWFVKWTLDGRDLMLTWHDGNRRAYTDWNRLSNGRWERVG